MIIGCPKEIKASENRVGLIPSTVRALVNEGATVLVEKDAGLGSFIPDRAYEMAGALIIDGSEEIWRRSDIIAKVKEPLPGEYQFFREGQVIYTFLHLAAEPELTERMLAKKAIGIAYETIEVAKELPLLKPMSEVAGRMAVQVGAWCLENRHGGKGILLGGVPGVEPARVLILGGGVVGKNAAKMAIGMGALVTIVDINASRLEEIDDLFSGRVQTVYSSEEAIASMVERADLVIGAVLLTGARAPRLVTKEMIKSMEQGSAVIDVAVDQGGCIETARRTTHEDPIYVLDGVVHYGVANMPGAVAKTSTFALSHATAPYLIAMAKNGISAALDASPALKLGVNTMKGQVTNEAVAASLGRAYVRLEDLL